MPGPYPTSPIKYIPPRKIYPDYRQHGEYVGFDPMDYCSQLRELVESGELTWSEANSRWREYADSVAAEWVDQPRPGPCQLSDAGEFPSTDWSAAEVGSYYDPSGGWAADSPTIQDEYLGEYYDSFNPYNWFGVEELEPPAPWQTLGQQFAPPGPLARSPIDPQLGFDIQESDEPEMDGPGGAPFIGDPYRPGVAPIPPVASPTVLPMFRGTDGVYRDLPVSFPYYEHGAQPAQQPIVEFSPYMSLPVASSFSIKGGDCGCHDCQCGGS